MTDFVLKVMAFRNDGFHAKSEGFPTQEMMDFATNTECIACFARMDLDAVRYNHK